MVFGMILSLCYHLHPWQCSVVSMTHLVIAQIWKKKTVMFLLPIFFYHGILKRNYRKMTLNFHKLSLNPLPPGGQWLSGRVLDSRPKGRGFKPHRRHCLVSLSKTY